MSGRRKPLRFCLRALAAAALLSGLPAGVQPVAGQTVSVEVQLARQDEHEPVPFELVQNHILFKARVDGQEVWATLDNGFDRTAIDLGFGRARKLGVSAPIGQGGTPTGRIELRQAINVPIEIPGQIRFSPPVVVTDLSAISRQFGVPVALVLGGDNFAFLSFFISPSQRIFQLTASGAMTAPPNSAVLILKNDKPQIDITIEGRPALVTLDMGDDVTVSVGEAAAKRLGLHDRPAVPGESRGAEGGVVATRAVVAETIGIGPARVDKVPVVIRPAALAGTGDGTIGMGLLANSNFLIDIKARRLWLIAPVGASHAEIAAAAASAARLYKAGATAEAERQFVHLRAIPSASPEDLNAICWAKASAGILLDSALIDCEAAVKLGGADPRHLDSLGMVLLQSGRLQESIAAYSQAIDKAQLASAYMGRALARARLGDAAPARADLAEARRRDPAVEKAYADLGLRLTPAAKDAP